MKPKRVNKSKAQIEESMKQTAKVLHEKDLAKKIWKFLENQDTIYDAQTVLNAASGFIQFEIAKKADELKVSECAFDLSQEKETKMKKAILDIAELIKDEKAKDTAAFLERFAKTLAMYGANQYLKNDMKVLKITDIIA